MSSVTFVSSVENLVNTFKVHNVELSVPNNVCDNVFTVQQTNQTEVLAMIDKLANSHSKDLFHLDTAFLKKHKNTLATPLTPQMNLSLTSGIFPSKWKLASVIPIFKSGTVDQACNFRAVSVLSVFSKVLENFVAHQLLSYVESNNYLHPLSLASV